MMFRTSGERWDMWWKFPGIFPTSEMDAPGPWLDVWYVCSHKITGGVGNRCEFDVSWGLPPCLMSRNRKYLNWFGSPCDLFVYGIAILWFNHSWLHWRLRSPTKSTVSIFFGLLSFSIFSPSPQHGMKNYISHVFFYDWDQAVGWGMCIKKNIMSIKKILWASKKIIISIKKIITFVWENIGKTKTRRNETRRNEETKKQSSRDTKKRRNEETKQPRHEETKKRSSQDTKKRRNEETKQPRNEETKKRSSQDTKKRRNEDTKKWSSQDTKKRRNEAAKTRRNQGMKKAKHKDTKKRSIQTIHIILILFLYYIYYI